MPYICQLFKSSMLTSGKRAYQSGIAEVCLHSNKVCPSVGNNGVCVCACACLVRWLSGAEATVCRGSVPLHWAQRYNVNNYTDQPIRQHAVVNTHALTVTSQTHIHSVRLDVKTHIHGHAHNHAKHEVLEDTRQRLRWHYWPHFRVSVLKCVCLKWEILQTDIH